MIFNIELSQITKTINLEDRKSKYKNTQIR